MSFRYRGLNLGLGYDTLWYACLALMRLPSPLHLQRKHNP